MTALVCLGGFLLILALTDPTGFAVTLYRRWKDRRSR